MAGLDHNGPSMHPPETRAAPEEGVETDTGPPRSLPGSPPPSRRRQLNLPVPLLLALRYLKSSRRDAYVSLLSALAGGGIALGVAALVLVLAGLSGLQSFLRQDVLARTPHVEIELPTRDVVGAGGDGAFEPEVAIEAVAGVEGVRGVRRLIRGRLWMLVSGGALDVTAVGYEGGLPEFFPGASEARLFTPGGIEVEDLLAEGAEEGPGAGLYLPDQLAIRWGLEVGDLVELVSSRPTLTPFGPQPRTLRMALRGTFRGGRLEDSQPRVALPLAAAERLIGGRRQRLEVRADDLEGALELAPRLAAVLPAGSRVETWQDLNRGLFFAFKLEKVLMFVSVFLIVPVAAMALVTVLALLISSKRAEIGMLQAMGARPPVLRRAFLTLGSVLAMGGLGIGLGLGISLALVLDRYQLLRPPGDVYLLDHIPFVVLPRDVAIIAFATLALTLASTLYAARKAASTRPVEALKP